MVGLVAKPLQVMNGHFWVSEGQCGNY